MLPFQQMTKVVQFYYRVNSMYSSNILISLSINVVTRFESSDGSDSTKLPTVSPNRIEVFVRNNGEPSCNRPQSSSCFVSSTFSRINWQKLRNRSLKQAI